MPVNYTNYKVQADVIDIKVDSPQQGDIFLVDTNVWYWLTYAPATSPPVTSPSATSSSTIDPSIIYSNYITAIVTVGATLCCSGLSLAELAHLIEQEEHKLSPYGSSRKPKQYRHNYPQERAKVVSKVQRSWNQVQNTYAHLIHLDLNQKAVDAALTRFSSQCLDGYDLFILESMQQESINQIITHDADYVTVPGIQVFTANRGAINSAKHQGKLITR